MTENKTYTVEMEQPDARTYCACGLELSLCACEGECDVCECDEEKITIKLSY